jgi:predicted aspartyl protease
MLDFNPSHRTMGQVIGKIQVKVKLKNAIDEGLVERGLLNLEEIHILEAEAWVDSAFVRTVIPMRVAEKLSLRIRSQEIINEADGSQETVLSTGPVLIEVEGRSTARDVLIAGDEVVIGLTALETLDLVVDYENKRLIPNPKNPDYPVFRI